MKEDRKVFIGHPFKGKEEFQDSRKGFVIGTSKEYDIKGRLINEVNYEQNFKFTLQDVKDYLKKEYKIDFLSPEKFATIERYSPDGKSIWFLYLPDPNALAKRLHIQLDGNTGEIIYKKGNIGQAY